MCNVELAYVTCTCILFRNSAFDNMLFDRDCYY